MFEIPYLIFCGFCFGLYLFVKGFLTYREYTFLANIPKARIRGVPMGLVHIRGKATWEQAEASPVDQTPCLFYHLEIYRPRAFQATRWQSPWKLFETDCDWRPFYLEDDTGKILVDAREAEIRLEDCKGFSRAENGIEEYPTQVQVETLQDLVPRRIEALRHSPLPEAAKQSRLAKTYQWNGLGGPFLLKERCIQPGKEYTVIGSCVEIPPNKDGVRRQIVKGANDPKFKINSMDERLREEVMRKDALSSIYLGGVIAVALLAVLMYLFRALIEWVH